MSDRTKIEWADATWSPVTGCTRVSAGCDHCYIERTPPFRMAHRKFDGAGPGSSTGVVLHPQRLTQPLHWRKPRRVFVNSLADLFHNAIPTEYIARVFAIAALAPQHTFQILTKRPGRMRSLVGSERFMKLVAHEAIAVANSRPGTAQIPVRLVAPPAGEVWWPLPNIWLGATVESQEWAKPRIDALYDTPAAVRFLSCEPLLGPLNLTEWLMVAQHTEVYPRRQFGMTMVDWVICGGESGPSARPMHPDWARSLRDQCAAAGVPFLFKQWGEWQDGSAGPDQRGPNHIIVPDGRHEPAVEHGAYPEGARTELASDRLAHRVGRGRCVFISRVGKKAAGRDLDGRTWDEYPRSP